jgi:tetratricopeptide (TPR) repeat protein
MNRVSAAFALLAAGSLWAAEPPPSLVPPPPPAQTPPAPLPAPPANTARIVPIAETIPDWQARWEMARALSYLQRFDESLGEYRKVLKERPADNKIRQDYGQVLLWSGRSDEAYAELGKIPAEELSTAASLALGDALVARRAYPEAEAIFRREIERAGDDQLTRLKLAELLSWTKRYDESLKLYRTILAALPDDVQVRRRYALVLLWAGHPDESAAEMRRTLTE